MAHTFKNIKVWQKAHEFVLEIYKLTTTFPVSERYGLTSQIRRSAASIPTNIVEGYKRRSDKEFAHFLNIADASLEETKYHLLLSNDLKYIDKCNYERLIVVAEEVGRMLYGLQKSLQLKAYSL